MDYENARVKAKNQGILDNIHSLQRRYDIKLKEYEQVLAEYQLLQNSLKQCHHQFLSIRIIILKKKTITLRSDSQNI